MRGNYWLLQAESGLTRRLFGAKGRRIAAQPVQARGRPGLQGKIAEKAGRTVGACMEAEENIRLAGFEVLEQAEGLVWRSKAAAVAKNCSLVGSKVANGLY